MNDSSLSNLTIRAASRDADALGMLLQQLRPYLCILARRHMDGLVKARIDPSDVVQQTCLEAYRDRDAFRGTSERQLMAWIQQIRKNNVAQSLQTHIGVQKRSILCEQTGVGADGRSILASLPGSRSSPSQRALRGELVVRLASEIEKLPEDQREAVRLRHLEGLSLAGLAQYFKRSESAVAGLVKRGLQTLRRQLTDVAEDLQT